MKRTTLAIAIAALCTGISGGAFAQDSDSTVRDSEVIEEHGTPGDKHPAAMGGGNRPSDNDEKRDPDNLMSQEMRDLEGESVVNQKDEEIGSISRIVEHKESGELYAIISIGGLWGIGDEEVALPLSEIELKDDQLMTNTTYGSDEIEASAEKYDEDNYSQFDNNMTLEEAQRHPN